MKTRNNQKGIATIPIVLSLMILVIMLGLVISTGAFNEVYISREYIRSSQALVYAEAGARDALIKITRDGRYTSAGYEIEFVTNGCTTNDGCTTVTVDSATSPKTIVSEGRVGNYIRKVQITVTLDTNWVITDTDWQEITS